MISVKLLKLRFQADINFITWKHICKIVVILINKQMFPLISCSSRLFVFFSVRRSRGLISGDKAYPVQLWSGESSPVFLFLFRRETCDVMPVKIVNVHPHHTKIGK